MVKRAKKVQKGKTKENKLLAVGCGLWGGLESLAKRVPVIGDIVEGLEKYQQSIKDQSREQFLDQFNKTYFNLDEEVKKQLQEYFNTKQGELFAIKIIESSLNAEYKDKQEIFINALCNGIKVNVLEDEKLRFIDLIRHLSRAALNVLSVIYELYNKDLSGKIASHQIIIRNVATKSYKDFNYPPELTDSALRELKNIGLFSNILNWRKQKGLFGDDEAISEGSYIPGDSFAYTEYTRKFIQFITQN